jgi:hypothetical protein
VEDVHVTQNKALKIAQMVNAPSRIGGNITWFWNPPAELDGYLIAGERV